MKGTKRLESRRLSALVHSQGETRSQSIEFTEKTDQENKRFSNYPKYYEPKPQFGSKSKQKIISLFEIAKEYNVKMISSSQIIALSFDLYTAGYIDQEQHLLLSFQAELQPNFRDTIGALIHQNPTPNKQKNFITFWLEKCTFEKNYPGPDRQRIYRLNFILNMLTALDKMAQIAENWKKTNADDDKESIPNLPSLSLKRMEY